MAGVGHGAESQSPCCCREGSSLPRLRLQILSSALGALYNPDCPVPSGLRRNRPLAPAIYSALELWPGMGMKAGELDAAL